MELTDGPLDMAKLDATLKSILLMFVAKSLTYLHSQGVVHLDLKPANILMLANRAKLGDFGSAKLFGLSVTQTSIALTQSYASPDALSGGAPSPAMDIYSFAIIAFELATGKPAFDPTMPPMLLMRAIGDGELPEIPAEVNPALKEVIERGWATDPKQRPPMAEICEILAKVKWCVFPGADPKKVAEAELELPIDETSSPATIAIGFRTLQAEVSSLKDENAQIPALKSENASLKAENASLKAENARLQAEIARISEVLTPSGPVAPGTLLAGHAQAMESLNAKIKGAELLFGKGAGVWRFAEFIAAVVGKSPLVVIVEPARGDVSGGLAMVSLDATGYPNNAYFADPTGASCVFSPLPTAGRYPLNDKAKALFRGNSFGFGDCCLTIWDDGDCAGARTHTRFRGLGDGHLREVRALRSLARRALTARLSSGVCLSLVGLRPRRPHLGAGHACESGAVNGFIRPAGRRRRCRWANRGSPQQEPRPGRDSQGRCRDGKQTNPAGDGATGEMPPAARMSLHAGVGRRGKGQAAMNRRKKRGRPSSPQEQCWALFGLPSRKSRPVAGGQRPQCGR